MAERRTIADAVGLTPQLSDFIKSGVPASSTARGESSKPKPTETVADVPISSSPELRTQRGRPRRNATSMEKAGEVQPDHHAVSVLDEMLVPVTTKLRRRTVQALRRAYLEQKLRDLTPATQQEIVEQAVSEWLKRNGFQERA